MNQQNNFETPKDTFEVPHSTFPDKEPLNTHLTVSATANDNYTALQRVPWYRIHGAMDFVGEAFLLTAGLTALADKGSLAIPVAIATTVAVLPDMAHSLIGLIKGDGSHASADISAKLSQDVNFVDPQDRYNDAVLAGARLAGHYLPFSTVKLTDEQVAEAKETVKQNRGILINFKEYPNEAGRTLEAFGKIFQSVTGIAAMAYNPVAGAFQTAAGALNAAAVAFDFVPEQSKENIDASPDKSVLRKAWNKVRAAPQAFAGGTQMAASALYLPAAAYFGASSLQGKFLFAAVAAWGIGYAAKMMATKRGYGLNAPEI